MGVFFSSEGLCKRSSGARCTMSAIISIDLFAFSLRCLMLLLERWFFKSVVFYRVGSGIKKIKGERARISKWWIAALAFRQSVFCFRDCLFLRPWVWILAALKHVCPRHSLHRGCAPVEWREGGKRKKFSNEISAPNNRQGGALDNFVQPAFEKLKYYLKKPLEIHGNEWKSLVLCGKKHHCSATGFVVFCWVSSWFSVLMVL